MTSSSQRKYNMMSSSLPVYIMSSSTHACTCIIIMMSASPVRVYMTLYMVRVSHVCHVWNIHVGSEY